MNRLGIERGWPEMTRSNYDAASSLRGSLLVGSSDEVIEKILYQYKIFGHQRLLLQISLGALPHSQVLHAIELFGTKVAPVVRHETEVAPIKASF